MIDDATLMNDMRTLLDARVLSGIEMQQANDFLDLYDVPDPRFVGRCLNPDSPPPSVARREAAAEIRQRNFLFLI